MRIRTGNPFAVERPGAWWVYDFIAGRQAEDGDVPPALTLACPDLRVDGQCVAHWTSRRPDGSCYVAIGIDQDWGRALTHDEQQAIKDLVGESDDWPLGCGYDAAVLTGLGFLPVDPPLRDVPVTEADVYRALDVLLLYDEPTWWFKVRQMDQSGFTVDFSRQHPRVWDALANRCGICWLPRRVA